MRGAAIALAAVLWAAAALAGDRAEPACRCDADCRRIIDQRQFDPADCTDQRDCDCRGIDEFAC